MFSQIAEINPVGGDLISTVTADGSPTSPLRHLSLAGHQLGFAQKGVAQCSEASRNLKEQWPTGQPPACGHRSGCGGGSPSAPTWFWGESHRAEACVKLGRSNVTPSQTSCPHEKDLPWQVANGGFQGLFCVQLAAYVVIKNWDKLRQSEEPMLSSGKERSMGR